MIKLNLNKEDTIFIFNEKYEILDIVKESRIIGRDELKFYTYKLKSKNENIFHAEISIYSKKDIFLKTIRTIDCKINSKSIEYNGKVYQIFNEYYDVEYSPREDKVKRVKIYELHDIKDRIINFDNPRQIVVKKNGDKIFHNFQRIKITDIKRNKDINIKNKLDESKKIKIKFKDPIG
jgi:hypothetical protein